MMAASMAAMVAVICASQAIRSALFRFFVISLFASVQMENEIKIHDSAIGRFKMESKRTNEK